MVKMRHIAAALAAAGLHALAAASVVPAGTPITGAASGGGTVGMGLVGLDAGYADLPGSNVTGLSDSDLEFLSNDAAFSVGIDFASDGSLALYDNTGTGLLAGSWSFTFDFAGLPAALTAFDLVDLSGVTGGSVSARLIDGDTVQLSLRDVAFAAPFGRFTAQVAAAAVPEPGSLALAGAALATLMAGSLRRARRFHRS